MNLNRSNVVLAVLVVGLAVPTALQLGADADTFVDIARVPLLFDGFTSDNLSTLRLRQPKAEQPPIDPANPNAPRQTHDELVFQKVDKGWALGQGELAGAPVSKERVESDILLHLRGIRADRDVLVQQNATPAQLAEFGLDAEHAFVVQAFDATQARGLIVDLLVGREASLGQTGTDAVRGVFVRKSDSTDVILYEFDKGWRRDVKSELWLDKVLARVQTEKIQKFSLRNAAGAGTTFTFERRDGKASWHPVDPPPGLGALRQSEVETLVQRLAYLAAQDFRTPLQRAGNLQQLGLLPPQIEFEVQWQDGDRDRILKLAVGNKMDGKNEYYLTSNESTFLLTWPAGNVVPFEVDIKAQWFDPAPPATAPATTPPNDGK